jgi:hypothetical protein
MTCAPDLPESELATASESSPPQPVRPSKQAPASHSLMYFPMTLSPAARFTQTVPETTYRLHARKRTGLERRSRIVILAMFDAVCKPQVSDSERFSSNCLRAKKRKIALTT